MTSTKSTIHKIEIIGAISGILSILFYFSVAAFSFLPEPLVRLFGFSFPLLWIVSFMGLYSFLRKEAHTATLEIAYIFGIIGGVLVLSLIVIQLANNIWHSEAMEAANSEETKNLLKATFRGTNRVQLGLDIAFDIFITISWFLFGVNIMKSPSFNKILGGVGSLLSAGLLVLNMTTFPKPPAESGWFDLGPFLGIWALVFYIWFTAVLYKRRNSID
ncbi:hypothetical protein ACOKFD_09960 [Flagellimonas sp. S174]|uniref:hypothetical protein n=1 Tax=Flagellimonas sp. S174 TaxID=3410790 RepID=UPI003BF5B5AE